MSMRDLLSTDKQSKVGFWNRNAKKYTIRDIEMVVTSLFALNTEKITKNTIKRFSITRGSKLIYQHLRSDQFEGFVDLHTVTYEQMVENGAGIYCIRLSSGGHSINLFTRTKDSFLKWIQHLDYYTIRNDFEENYFFMDFIRSYDRKVLTKVRCLLGDRILIGKIIFKDEVEANLEKVINEIILSRSISHGYIAEIKNMFIHEDNLILVYDVDYNENSSLDAIIRNRVKLSSDDKIYITKCLIAIIRYCHHNKIILRQFSPEHVIIHNQKKLMLFDLSNCVFEDQVGMEITKAYPGFLAPEIIKGEDTTKKVDVFTLGVMIYLIHTGTFPFYGKDRSQIIQKVVGNQMIKNGEFANLKMEIKEMIRECLENKVQDRSSVKVLYGMEMFKKVEMVEPKDHLTTFTSRKPNRTRSVLSRLRTKEDLFSRTISAEYLHFKDIKIAINPYSNSNQKLEILQRNIEKLQSKKSICNASKNDHYSELMMNSLYCKERGQSNSAKGYGISTQEQISSIIIPQDTGLRAPKVTTLGRTLNMRNKFMS